MPPQLSRRPWWYRLRPSVRGLIVLILVVGGGLGWFVRRATIQRDAVKAIVATGGTVRYDFQRNADVLYYNEIPYAPRWLVDLIGIDYFGDVAEVWIKKPQSEAILAQVGKLRRLERVFAGNVRVTEGGLTHLERLSELRSLEFAAAPELTDASLARLVRFTRLEAVWIEGATRIKGPGLAHLADLERLRFLSIDTKSDIDLSSLSRLTRVRGLFLHTPKMTDAILADLSRLTWLEDLALWADAGSDTGMPQLKALTKLGRLQLHGPWFTDAGLARLSEMDHLSDLGVFDETSVTPGGLNNLQQRRPALIIGVNGTSENGQLRRMALRAAVGPAAFRTGQQSIKTGPPSRNAGSEMTEAVSRTTGRTR